MADRIAFDLVSPEKLLYSDKVEMVVAPGEEGEFGILPLHAPFMTTLTMGAVKVYEGGQPKDIIFVNGGFAEATPEQFTILANRAIARADADGGALKAERDTLAQKRDEDEKAGRAASVAQADGMLAFLDWVGEQIAV